MGRVEEEANTCTCVFDVSGGDLSFSHKQDRCVVINLMDKQRGIFFCDVIN